MNTSQITTFLSKPEGNERVSSNTFTYFRTRNKSRVFNIVHEEFEKSGLTQTCLGQRLGMDKGQLSRYLNAPGNWTLDMFSDFLFAISGGVPVYDVYYPLDQPPRNYTAAEWLSQTKPATHTESSANLNYKEKLGSGSAASNVDLVLSE